MPFSDDELSSLRNNITGMQDSGRTARIQAIGGIEANPDQAARSLELAQRTGVHPDVVDLDPERFEQEYKTQAVGHLVATDPHLQRYLNEYPLAAKVSNDDFEQLSKAGQVTKGIWENTYDVAKEGFTSFIKSPLTAVGIGDTQAKHQAKDIEQYLVDQGLDLSVATREAQLVQQRMNRGEALQSALFGPAQVLLSPFIGAYRTFISQPIQEKTGFPAEATEGLTMAALMAIGLKAGKPAGAAEIREVIDHGLPYIANGEVPPPGVHEVFDTIHKEQAKADNKAPDEAEKEAGKSATRDRSPDALEAFLRGPTEGRTFGLGADAVRELYGDKEPGPGDGLLGDAIPDIAAQLKVAEQTGGDVEVAAAKWLSKVEPEVQEALHDHRRVRPEGMTLWEAKSPEERAKGLGVKEEEEPKAAPEKVEGEEAFQKAEPLVQSVEDLARKEANLAPLVESGQTFRLKKVKEEEGPAIGRMADMDPEDRVKSGEQPFRTYEIHGDRGKIGEIVTQLTDKKMIYVEDVKAGVGHGVPNVLGAKAIIRIAKELRKEYPEATSIGGYRVSGARGASGKDDVFIQIPLKHLLEDEGEQSAFADAMGLGPKGWESVGGTEGAQTIPDNVRTGGESTFIGKGNERTTPLYTFKARDILGKLDDSYLTGVAKILSTFFKGKLTQLAGDIDVRVISHEDMNKAAKTFGRDVKPGSYQPGYHHIEGGKSYIVLDNDWLAMAQPHSVTHIVLHEAAHAATVEAMNKDPILHGKVERLMQATDKWLSENFPKDRETHKYAFQDAKEFMAESYSKPAFQEILSTMVLDKDFAKEFGFGPETRTMWDAVSNLVASVIHKLTGLRPPPTVMDALLKLGEEFEKKLKPEGKGTSFAEGERLKQAAYKVKDKVYTASNHILAMDAAVKDLGLTGYDELIDAQPGKDLPEQLEAHHQASGFVTSTGRFITRDEAKPIGEAAGQGKATADRGIKSEDVAFAEPEGPLFKNAKAVGFTKEGFKKIQEQIAKRNAEDEARQLERNMKEETRKQTAEWKAVEKDVRAEVTEQINQRPDIAADDFLRDGPFTSEKTGRVRLSAEALSEEQKAELPKHYYAKGGTDPSALAGFFGFSSGEVLVKRLANLAAVREGMGLEPKEYKKALVDHEVERQMKAKFGDLDENILNEAREAVHSQTQMELLHQETLALALKAGLEEPISLPDLKVAVKEDFKGLPLTQARDPKRFIRAEGRAGDAVQEALLRGKSTEAFKEKQRQTQGALYVKEAYALQKEYDKAQALLKRFSQRQVSSVAQEYTDQIHGIMSKLSASVKRSVQDLSQALVKGGSLEDFVRAKEADLREVPVADFLYDPAFKKPLDQMTVEEFRAVHDSLKALAHNGRSELQVEKAGEKRDFEEIKSQMIEQLESFRANVPPPLHEVRGKIIGAPTSLRTFLRSRLAEHLQVETLLNRWDKFDPKGVFNQYVMRNLVEGTNRLAALEKEFSKKLSALEDDKRMNETIENPLFRDPLSPTKEPLQLTRKNLRVMLGYAGSKGSFERLLKSYDVSEEAFNQWVDRVATKEDWDFVQNLGGLFNQITEHADRMYERLSGIGVEKRELRPVQTRHGNYDGWYYPVFNDPIRKIGPTGEGGSRKVMGRDPLAEGEYTKATTSAGYTKKLTGYKGPPSLDLDMFPVRMKQMLNDIAMREAVINAGKVFYDKDIHQAIQKHSFLGPEVADMLIPYLRDVTNNANIDSAAAAIANSWSEFTRQNAVATLVGLNPTTVMKHGPTALVQSVHEVGVAAFAKEFTNLFTPDGWKNLKFAINKSEELQRRDRNFKEVFRGAYQGIVDERSFRDFMINLGSKPVAWSDMLSAVPTWLAKYKAEIRAGASEGDAVFEADRAVRRAHGSTSVTNLAAVSRSNNALGRWMTSVYGFFSHIMNRQIELVWRAGDTLGKVKNGELKDALADAPQLTSGLFAYVIMPAVFEELATGSTNDQHEGWGLKAGKALIHSLAGSYVGVRDVVNGLLLGKDPTLGLMGSAVKPVADLYRDIVSMATKGKVQADRLIEHGTTALGMTAGLANAQMGRTGKFTYNILTGKDKPKGIGQWLHGLRFGESKTKRK